MIDVAAFSGPWPWRPIGLPAAGLAAHLAEAGVTHALVTPLEGIFWDDPQLANEALAKQLSGLPLTLVPAVDPTFPSWRRDLESCLNRYGTRALRIFPGYRGFSADHPACRELFELASREGCAVFVQLRMLDTRGHSLRAPYPDASLGATLSMAACVPGARVILGGVRLGEVRGAVDEIRAMGNVWIETSGVEYVDGFRSLVSLVGVDRILFGTHTPLFITLAATRKLEEARLDSRERSAITEENARSLFAL
jgi:hypothetical protein